MVSVSTGGTKDKREVEIERNGGDKKKNNWNVTCSRTEVDAQVWAGQPRHKAVSVLHFLH